MSALLLPAATGAAPAPARPSAVATRIAPGEAPSIDGSLADPVWAKAAIIDDFRQVDPAAGEPGTERTAVRILYDADTFYIGVYAYDSEPDRIIKGAMSRDGNLGAGDLVRIFLDPGQTRRDGYSFEVGSAGGRRDALVQNNGDFIVQWDTIWNARTSIAADGWIAEIAIPFRSLSYDRERAAWGFDFTRAIRRKEERVRWTSYETPIGLFDISQSGDLTGIAELTEGVGLDVQVYGRLSYKHDWMPEPGSGALSGTGGANAFYRITPALTGTLTLNPDFSDSPLDPRQINLSRFSLFTPETRDFFLQDAAAFEFGGRNFPNQNGRPFFSRNIGLVGSRPVTVLGGAKLSGQYDALSIGALTARTNPTRTTDGQLLSAARLTTRVLAESRAGVIITNGDPDGETDNTVAGTDFQYRDSRFLGEKIFQADLFYQRSFSSLHGDDDGFGVAFNYPNEPVGAWLRAREIGAEFSPALGFVNRPGIRVYEGGGVHLTRFPAENYVRTLQFGANNNLVTGLDDREQSRFHAAWINSATARGDSVNLEGVHVRESVPAEFLLPGDVPVPAGQYQWTNFNARLNTTQGRPYALFMALDCCSFYDGDYVRGEIGLTLRPSDMFEISPRYNVTFINMPTGYVAIHVPTLDAAINFTPDMQLFMQAQFDNVSRGFGFSARYRWEYAPGDELFAAFGQSAEIPGTTFVAQTSQFSVRLGHTFRL